MTYPVKWRKSPCHALSDKKAEDVQVIDISEISVIADYFVIASAANTNQLQAMMDAAEEELYKAGYHCAQKEGNNNSSWILMDYKDIIIHLFSKEESICFMILRESGRMVKLFHRKNCNFSFFYLSERKMRTERKSRQTRMIFNRPVLDFAPDLPCLHAELHLFKESECSNHFSQWMITSETIIGSIKSFSGCRR